MKTRTGVRATTDQGWGAGLVIQDFPRVRKEHADTTFLLANASANPARDLDTETRAGIFHQTLWFALVSGILLLVVSIHQAAQRAGEPIPARGTYQAMTGCDGGAR